MDLFSHNSGFPPGNRDPAKVSWHRAGIFWKKPLVWPAWDCTAQRQTDFIAPPVTCWLVARNRETPVEEKDDQQETLTLRTSEHSQRKTHSPALSQPHTAEHEWASGLGLVAHSQAQEIKCQVGLSFWKALSGFFFPNMLFLPTGLWKNYDFHRPWRMQPWGFCLSRNSHGKLTGKRGSKELKWEL